MPKSLHFLASVILLLIGLATPAAAQIQLEHGVNRNGSNYYKRFYASTPQSCAAVCSNEGMCRGFVWVQAGGQCRLQTYVHAPTMNVCCVSGVKQTVAAPPATGYPAGCAAGEGAPPRASLHFVNRGFEHLRLIVNGQRLRDVGPYGQNAERHVLPPGRNMIQIVLPSGQYMTKYVIVVNHGARTCQSWANVSYP